MYNTHKRAILYVLYGLILGVCGLLDTLWGKQCPAMTPLEGRKALIWATHSLIPRPLAAFQCCTREAEGPGIRSPMQYVTIHRVVDR